VLEKDTRRVTRHLEKKGGSALGVVGREEGKVEEKVRGCSRERGRAYIDAMAALGRQGTHVKAARLHAILNPAGAIPQRAVGCPSAAGGGRRQADGAMAAVSSAPLTVSLYTRIISYRPRG
jgi:6-phosphofructokinase